MLDRAKQIRIILNQPSHPGNIGSTARAMKTMGLSRLTLVAPKYFPHADAIALAAGADDILAVAIVTDSLDAAIGDCHLLIGTSARTRSLPWPLLTPRECAVKISAEASSSEIGVLFGREDSGLPNEALQRCHYHVQIPSNPEYSSLNLAAAVQILAYEIRMALLDGEKALVSTPTSTLTDKEMELFYTHLEETLYTIGFIKPDTPNRIMPRLRRLYNRARPDAVEMNILRGILSEIDKGR